MKLEQIIESLGLEEKHFEVRKKEVPVIDSHLYTTLGRQLFELYQKHEIPPEDQRDIENLGFLLNIFTLDRDSKPKKRGFLK